MFIVLRGTTYTCTIPVCLSESCLSHDVTRALRYWFWRIGLSTIVQCLYLISLNAITASLAAWIYWRVYLCLTTNFKIKSWQTQYSALTIYLSIQLYNHILIRKPRWLVTWLHHLRYIRKLLKTFDTEERIKRKLLTEAPLWKHWFSFVILGGAPH